MQSGGRILVTTLINTRPFIHTKGTVYHSLCRYTALHTEDTADIFQNIRIDNYLSYSCPGGTIRSVTDTQPKGLGFDPRRKR